jgi:hypothetical protein
MAIRSPNRFTFAAFALSALCCGCDAIVRDATDPTITSPVEMAVFEGGYGIDWHQKIAGQFNEAKAGEGIKVDLWGDPGLSRR